MSKRVKELLDTILLDDIAREIEEERDAVLAKLEELKPKVPPSTTVKELTDFEISGEFDFLKLEGSGIIEELLVQCASKAYSLVVEVDGKKPFDGDYDDYDEKSDYIDQIGAAYTDGYYWLHLTSISYAKNIRIRIITEESITFKRAYAKYF